MPKMKTHSASKKRFRITRNGKVVYKKCGRGHLLSTKNSKRLRSLKKNGVLPTVVAAHVKKVMPYA
jgi:large subunit ribosomal protein L35